MCAVDLSNKKVLELDVERNSEELYEAEVKFLMKRDDSKINHKL
jgi:hypothetical protein